MTKGRNLALAQGDRPFDPRSLPARTVCITGMHRSGTSAISRLVNLAGVDLGDRKRLLGALPENPEGFWEHSSIVELNERILRRLGGNWSDPPPLPDGWERAPRLDGLRWRALQLVMDDFEAGGIAGWKDPRTSLLLPFWRSVLPIDATVLVIRHPSAVAGSLAKRNAFAAERSAYLWLRYVSAAWRDDPQREVVDYDEALRTPDVVVQRLVGALDLPRPAEAELARITRAIRRDLRHEHEPAQGPMMRLATDVYDAIVGGDSARTDETVEALHRRWAERRTSDRVARAGLCLAYSAMPSRLRRRQILFTEVGAATSKPLQRATLADSPAVHESSAPIAIGGLGGSGTRVVAELCEAAGVDMGRDLNSAADHLAFTLLFKRPTWLAAVRSERPEALALAVDAFVEAATGRSGVPLRYPGLVARAAADAVLWGQERESVVRRVAWTSRRVVRALQGHQIAGRWGWKEPNTYLLLDEIVRRLPDLRYVHVIRHGLDMAFSANQNQLRNWGTWFGVENGEGPRAQLEFWLRANHYAISRGRALLGDRFHVVNVDALCSAPELHVRRLLEFIGADVDAGTFDRLLRMPRTPASAGRYAEHDLGVFTREQLEAVRALGFEVRTVSGA